MSKVQASAGADEKALQDIWESLKAFLLALGDDVQMKELEQYVAFRQLKNFACVKLRSRDLQMWTRLDPSTVVLEEGFTRDVSQSATPGPAIWRYASRRPLIWNGPSLCCGAAIKPAEAAALTP